VCTLASSAESSGGSIWCWALRRRRVGFLTWHYSWASFSHVATDKPVPPGRELFMGGAHGVAC
jgi:hypothetical protein